MSIEWSLKKSSKMSGLSPLSRRWSPSASNFSRSEQSEVTMRERLRAGRRRRWCAVGSRARRCAWRRSPRARPRGRRSCAAHRGRRRSASRRSMRTGTRAPRPRRARSRSGARGSSACRPSGWPPDPVRRLVRGPRATLALPVADRKWTIRPETAQRASIAGRSRSRRRHRRRYRSRPRVRSGCSIASGPPRGRDPHPSSGCGASGSPPSRRPSRPRPRR